MQVVHATGADWHCLVPSRKRLAYLKAGEMGRARILRVNGKNFEQVIGDDRRLHFDAFGTVESLYISWNQGGLQSKYILFYTCIPYIYVYIQNMNKYIYIDLNLMRSPTWMPSKLVKFSCDLLSGTRVCLLKAFQEHWAKNHLPRPELSIEPRNANIRHTISSASMDALRSRQLFLETPPRLTQNQVTASSGWFTKNRRKTCFFLFGAPNSVDIVGRKASQLI